MADHLDVLFETWPGGPDGPFVDVETPDGRSVVLSWVDTPDGLLALRITAADITEA